MIFKLVKVGNSYSVRLPMDVARPFVEAGEIELFLPGEKKSAEISKADEKSGKFVVLPTEFQDPEMPKEEKIQRLKNLLASPKQSNEETNEETSEEEELVLAEEEIPEEYKS